MTARIVRCRGVAVRRGAPNSGRLSFRRAARPSTPSTSTRGAANSIASGKPSSLRQISTTSGAFASVSAKSSTIAVTRSTNSCTAGKAAASAAVSLDDGCGLLRGPRRYSRSPATPSGSLLVARMLTPGAPLRIAAARLAAASMTCSQLSSSSSIRLSLRPATRPGSGSSVRISEAEHGRNRARHQARVAERRQIDQPDAVFVAGDHALGDREGDRGLADPSGPDDRHQALARQSRDERRHGFLAADHPSYRERQIVRRRRRDCRRQRGPRWLLEANRRNEIVASSRNGDDVAMAALAVAEGATQSADLNLQIRFFDEGLRPGSGDQFLLADHLAGAFDQSGQNVKSAAAEPHRLIALEQEPPRCNEPERAERDRVSIHGAGLDLFGFYQILLDQASAGATVG